VGNIKIIRVPIPTPTLWPHSTTNCYLIGNEQESVLVDAGYDQEDTRLELEKVLLATGMAKPKAIILTHAHPDHAPGVKQLTDWKPIIYCHTHELEDIQKTIFPMSIIKTLAHGTDYRIDNESITILHTPGHTKGHLSLYVPSRKTLIAGDNIVAEGTTWIGPPDGDMTDYMQTLANLKQLDLVKIGPGHGEWVMNPYEQIDFVLQRRRQREAQIIELVKGNPDLDSSNLTKRIYKDSIHPSLFEVARRTTEAHLSKLIKDGLIEQFGTTYKIKS
jgi:endoribonuclease LACTB2